MSKNKLEIRSFGGSAAPKIDGRTIDGYAIVFNQRSEVMVEWSAEHGKRRFVEIISPDAIDNDLLARSDVKATVEHNRERLLARSNRGKGTLNLTLDEHGMRYSFDAPKTVDGDFTVEMVSRGDMEGSSFAFNIQRGGDEWKKEGKDLWVRTVKKFSGIYDVTVTADPAYSQTEVSVRTLQELDENLEKEQEERNNPDDTNYKEQINYLRNKI